MKSKKICVLLHGLNNGGEEKVLYMYLSNILKDTSIDIDIVAFNSMSNICYEEFKKISKHIFFVPPKKKIFNYIFSIKRIIKNGNYDIVHSNLNQWNSIPLFFSKLYCVPIRISHCHIVENENIISSILKKLNRFLIKNFSTKLIGCSRDACNYLYGFNSGIVLPNCFNFVDFHYSSTNRKILLDKFCLNLNKIIIGNVGRLSLQKNHKLMIKIANIMKEKKYNMCFICVGCGELENEIKKEVFDNGLNDYFILVGETDSVNKFYSMFDVFCFPSLFEGLGIAFLEAQVSGLPCVISNKVPDEAVISSRVSKLNINDSPERWLDEICCLAKNSKSIDRINLCNFLLPSANQYEVGNNIEMLKQIYGME